MATQKEMMQSAKAYIKSGQYNKARSILIKIDHPTADKWLAQLNKKHPKPKQRGLIALSIVTFTLLILIVVFTAYVRYQAWGTIF
jgi:hypothetical protein